MKRLAALFVVLLLASISWAGGSGTPVWTESLELFSQSSGTVVEVAGTATAFQFPVKDLGCDISSSPTVSVVVRFEGHGGFSSSFHTIGLATATTCTWANCNVAITGKPIQAIRSMVTSATNTNATIRVRCLGMQ